MAAMDEEKIDVVVKIKREQGKKDEPPKLHTDLPASMTFQQLLEFEKMCHCLLRNIFFFLKTRKSGSVGRR